MKVLLLTDIPPCKDFTAGIVQDGLCRFLPEGSVACYAVVNRSISPKLSADLAIPIEYHKKPIERAIRLLPGKAGELIAKWVEARHERQALEIILPKVVEFGRKNQVDRIWCILQGQTMVRLARPVAKALGVPLYTQVWDPLGWWLRANKIDADTSARVLNEFDEVIRASRACATASWAMSKEYTAKYGVKNIPIISSLSSDSARPPATAPNQSDEFVIGMAGQIYATEEWNALIHAIDKSDWKVDGRKIKFRILSYGMPSGVVHPKNAEYLEWMSQKKAIQTLSGVDMLYLPYWFSPAFREEATLSFPSKLITYLAAGRPILFHGPEYASPARYLEENKAGLCCYSLEPDRIFEQIKLLATNRDVYRSLSYNGATAFARDFTHEKMKANFYKFLEIDSSTANERSCAQK
jgi:glycosyltransferase involved in cell wall biosynthesis